MRVSGLKGGAWNVTGQKGLGCLDRSSVVLVVPSGAKICLRWRAGWVWGEPTWRGGQAGLLEVAQSSVFMDDAKCAGSMNLRLRGNSTS